MASLIHLKSIESTDGILAVFEHLMPGHIERVYFIYNVPGTKVRGGHKHKQTWQGLVCMSGSCKVYVQENETDQHTYELNSPSTCLLLKPSDWHQMYDFSEDAMLLVLANKNYNPDDYVDKPYNVKNIIKA